MAGTGALEEDADVERTERAEEMAELAGLGLDRLPEELSRSARQPVDDPELRTWSYLPGDHPGVCLEDAPAPVGELVERLVDLAHSSRGAELIRAALAVDHERRRSVGAPVRGDRYWWRVIGDSSSGGTWGWRLNGHHVALHVVVRGDRITWTPHFIGSEPAHLTGGPLAGYRVLGPEEALARVLLEDLGPGQRGLAVSDAAPADILTGMDPVADPSALPAGIPRTALTAGQRRLLDRLVHRYLDRVPREDVAACWEAALADPESIAFAWAGDGRPGRPHYYCVRSSVFLIEYDNTQDGANHAHSAWRHLEDDFGGDPLRSHRRQQHTG